jgi:preprotein translocase subunit SecG
MFAFLLTLLILDALVLSVVVLLQAGQGGGLASLGGAGGTDTVVGGRQAVTILTKATWWCGGIFLVLSLILSFVPRGGGSSDLQERLRASTPAAPSGTLPLGGAPTTAAPPTDTKAAPTDTKAPPATPSPAPAAKTTEKPSAEKKKP